MSKVSCDCVPKKRADCDCMAGVNEVISELRKSKKKGPKVVFPSSEKLKLSIELNAKGHPIWMYRARYYVNIGHLRDVSAVEAKDRAKKLNNNYQGEISKYEYRNNSEDK